MNIIFIVLKCIPFGGGIEKFTEEVGSRLVNKGHKVTVYVIKGTIGTSYFYKGMRIIPTWSVRLRLLEKISAAFSATIRTCFLRDIDIVHFHAFAASAFCFLTRLRGIKTIIQGHGVEWKRSRWGILVQFFLRLTEFISIKSASIVTVDSQVQRDFILDRYDKESFCVPNGVSLPVKHTPMLINKFGLFGNDYILFAGRLVREKGVHYLVEAYKGINTKVKLVIAGEERHDKGYTSLLRKLAGTSKDIIFTGYAEGRLLQELFSNCFIFVLPSELEGLSIALLEAMSYGSCCLVSDIPENQEALSNLGYYFKSKDSLDLRDKLSYLLDNNEAVKAVRGKVQNYVLEKYSWDKITDRLVDVYQNAG